MKTTNRTKKAAGARRHHGADLRKVAQQSWVIIKTRSGDVIAGRFLSFLPDGKGGTVKVREGAGITSVNIFDLFSVTVDSSRGISNGILTPGKDNQKHRMLARYGEL